MYHELPHDEQLQRLSNFVAMTTEGVWFYEPYTAPEFWAVQSEAITIPGHWADALARMPQTFDTQQMCNAMNAWGNYIYKILRKMIALGLIKRIRPGLYAVCHD